MRPITTTLAACAALFLATQAQATDFSFSGLLGDGPLAGQAFSGSFSSDTAPVEPSFNGDLPLTAFTLQLGSVAYTLAGADFMPTAVYAMGEFVGLSYTDADSADVALRPHINFVPGWDFFADAFVGYVTAPGINGVSTGSGSYSVAVVPEPAAVLLMLAGLGVVGGMARRARRAGDQAER